MRWLCFTLIALVATAGVLISTAGAATVVKLDLPRLVSHSDVIVVADVIDTNAERGESGRVYTTITFRTDDTLKGQPGKEFSIRQAGGTDGDISTHVPGMPHFAPDQRVFLFVSDFDDRAVVTGLNQGRFDVVVDDDKTNQYVVPRLQGAHLVAPGDSPEATDDREAAKKQLRIRDHNSLFGQTHKFEAFRHQVQEVIDGQESSP